MDLFRALEVSAALFRGVLEGVRPDDLASPTPCEDWDVRDLLNHVIGGERRYALLLAGEPTEVVERTRTEDHLGGDPLGAFHTKHADFMAAAASPGALECVVHHRLGDRTGRDLIAMRVGEYALHGWDLATALGRSIELDPDVVAFVMRTLDASPELFAGEGVFAPPTESTGADSAQDILLRRTGRVTSGAR